MRAGDPAAPLSASYPGVPKLVAALSLAFLLACPHGATLAASIPGSKPVDLSTVPLRVVETPYRTDPMRKASRAWPAPAAAVDGEAKASPEEAAVAGRLGKGPWRLFEGTFAEESCRSPGLDGDGATALAICTGLDASRPEDANLVMVRSGALARYRFPVAELPAPEQARVDLSPDGRRFALVTGEGGTRTVHVVDQQAGKDWALQGGWRDPGNPVVASEADVVAFVARVGPDQAVIVADVHRPAAVIARRAPSGLQVQGLSSDGRKVVLVGDTADRSQLLLVDLDAGRVQVLSHRKSRVTSVAVHPSADPVVYGAEVGGVSAVYWVDVAERRRVELMTSVEDRYVVQGVDGDRRSILYTVVRPDERSILVHDRRTATSRYEVIKGCDEPALSDDGRLMTVLCPKARLGAGGYLFVLPPPRED